MTGWERLSLSIPNAAYLRDHRLAGGTVYPAVEAMAFLARAARSARPSLDITRMRDAAFLRFLSVPEDGAVNAFAEIEDRDSSLNARLVSLKTAPRTSISRIVEHVKISFSAFQSHPTQIDEILCLEGPGIEIDSQRLYRELVPFGPSYQNIERIVVADEGAIAFVSGGIQDAWSDLVGSPFPLDASFHAACVWGQRYRGIVAFPVGIGFRSIMTKTTPGGTYIARVAPRGESGGTLAFDIWIIDLDGTMCEEIRDVRMRDVSGNRLKPPAWIAAEDDAALGAMRSWCADIALLELATVTHAARAALSPEETERISRMGEKRARSFLAARLALKKIARRLSGGDSLTPPNALNTVASDGRPVCPVTAGPDRFCSVSHDSRFAVAVAADAPIGIDVEEISPRAFRGRSIFMNEDELKLIHECGMSAEDAALRVWSAKEAAGKAFNLDLVDSWKLIRVSTIGEDESAFSFNGRLMSARHIPCRGHLFTLVNVA